MPDRQDRNIAIAVSPSYVIAHVGYGTTALVRGAFAGMDWIILGAGLVVLLVGGDLLVRGAVRIADRLNLPQMLVGMVIVGFGTSAPELLVTVKAVADGAPGVAVGNIYGSSISNILLILAIAAVLRPIDRPRGVLFPDGLIFIVATGLTLALGFQGQIPAWQGGCLIALLLTILYREYALSRSVAGPLPGDPALRDAGDVPTPVGGSPVEIEAQIEARRRFAAFRDVLPWIALCIAGLTGLLIGSEMVVTGAVSVAKKIGVSDAVIGLTIIAVGTSIPELASAIVASLRGHSALAYGNIFGSNLFNLLGIMGVASFAGPLLVPADVALIDGGVLMASSLLMLATAASGLGIMRWEGALMLLAYIAYVYVRLTVG